MDDAGPSRLGDAEVEGRLAALDGLLEAIEAMPGVDGEVSRAAVAALAEVYGEGLARAVSLARAAPDGGRGLAGDQLLAHLMALHGLSSDALAPSGPPSSAFIPIASVMRRAPGRKAAGRS